MSSMEVIFFDANMLVVFNQNDLNFNDIMVYEINTKGSLHFFK